LPVVLSPREVADLLQAIRDPKAQVLLRTCYAAGLRISEARQLQVSDIDSRRMLIRQELDRASIGVDGPGRDGLPPLSGPSDATGVTRSAWSRSNCLRVPADCRRAAICANDQFLVVPAGPAHLPKTLM
jgi:hypothetical protein